MGFFFFGMGHIYIATVRTYVRTSVRYPRRSRGVWRSQTAVWRSQTAVRRSRTHAEPTGGNYVQRRIEITLPNWLRSVNAYLVYIYGGYQYWRVEICWFLEKNREKKRESKVKILEITFYSFKIVRKWFGVTSNEVLLAFEVKTRFRFFSEELDTKQYQTRIFFL